MSVDFVSPKDWTHGGVGNWPFTGGASLGDFSADTLRVAGLSKLSPLNPPDTTGPVPEVTIVLPTLNERENLPRLIEAIRGCCLPATDIIVVDDGSTDGTQEYVCAEALSDPRVRIILNKSPQTLARAHAQGILAARTPYVIMMDADLQHPPELIPQIVTRLKEGYDVVIASRYAPGGTPGPRHPFRGLLSRGASAIARLVLRNSRGLTDPISGYFGVRRNAVPSFSTMPRGYEILLFVLAGMSSPRISEIPYTFREREQGESKIVKGLTFVHVYLSGVLLAKRLEYSSRGQSRSHKV